jgi:hypothetical protein
MGLMFLEINMGLRKMKKKANVLAKPISGFVEPQLFENCLGNLTQFRVPLNSLVVMNSIHKSEEIQHLSVVMAFSDRPIVRLSDKFLKYSGNEILIFFFSLLGIKPRASCILNKYHH